LKLLYEASERRRAQAGLLDLEITQAAVASCMAKENAGMAKAVAKRLTKILTA